MRPFRTDPRRGSGFFLLLAGLLTIVVVHLTIQSRDLSGLLRRQRILAAQMKIETHSRPGR